MIAEYLKMVLVLSALVFNGMILYRALAIRMLKTDEVLSETQLFFHGLFLSILINGIVGQYLAMAYLFRKSVFAFIFVSNLVIFRKETVAISKYIFSIPSRFINLVRNSRVGQLFAWSLVIFVSALLSLRVQIPSLSPDVWFHHIPIAESIVKNEGFVYPTIPDLFFGNMPSFIELIFAEGLILIKNYSIAGLLHYFIYCSFLLLLFSFSVQSRGLALVILCWILVNPMLAEYAISPMGDTARACFEATSIVFLLMSLQEKRTTYYLLFSALLCGAGLASKYLGLLTLFLYGLIFMFEYRSNDDFLKKVGISLSAVLIVCGFWYGKNMIVYNNPIYPFIFRHPGLSNERMSILKEDLGKAFYPELRSYSRNLLTFRGWRDFIKATNKVFFYRGVFWHSRKTLPFMLIIMIISLLYVKSVTNLMAPASITYLALWYFLVFHERRYGITGYLLFLTAFYFSIISVANSSLFPKCSRRFTQYIPRLAQVSESVFIIGFILVFAMTVNIKKSARDFYRDSLDIAVAYTNESSFAAYMSKVFPYYSLYNFIASNQLRRVLNPFDSGSRLYMKYIIPGTKADDTFLPWDKMYAAENDMGKFVRENQIEYFVHLESLPPVALERLGGEHTDKTFRFMQVMEAISTVMFSDDRGNKLYRISRDKLQTGISKGSSQPSALMGFRDQL